MRDSSSPSDSSETITVTKRSALLALGAGILAIALVAGVAIAALVRTGDDPQPKNTAAEVSETSESEEPGKGDKEDKDKKDDKPKDKDKKKDGESEKDKREGTSKDREKKDSDKKGDSDKKKAAATPSAKSYSSGGSSKNDSSSGGSSKGSGSSGSDKSSRKTSSTRSEEKSSSSSQTSEDTSASTAPSTSDSETSASTAPPTDGESTPPTGVPADGFTVTSAEPTVEELDSLVQYLLTTDAPDEAKAQSLENGMLGVDIPQFLAGLGVGEDPQGEARVVGPLERSGDSITATLEYTAEGQTRLSTPVVFTNSDSMWKLSATSACAAAEGAGSPVGC